ncbi:uncharacterized protein LOC125712008 [Brienomyrus brachyistius]|uniref:uncharacterized protein LOC125712008 n=1 Tax=Brienomyrus brachyistius TaxID=42636 RepID=UPI0020B296C5|nr:uncharacterized protein LOC125712008 [Brienomyrus brachyistius]
MAARPSECSPRELEYSGTPPAVQPLRPGERSGTRGRDLRKAPETKAFAEAQIKKEPMPLKAPEKPLPRGAPGGLLRILGGLVALGLIVGVAVTVYTIYQRQHRTRSKEDNDGMDIPASHKCAPPPPLKRSGDSRTLLTSDDIQVLRLDKEAHHNLPPQTPYYDMAPTQSSHGKHHEDVSNPSVPLRRPHVHHTDFCLDSRPAAACLPLSYLPQNPCDRPAPTNPPGPQLPYNFPKEQTV